MNKFFEFHRFLGNDRIFNPILSIIRCNSNRSSIVRLGRQTYPRMYPTRLVFADGSTIQIRYKEPRKLIRLPLDLSALNEEEKAERLYRRKPKQKVVIEEDIDDGFDVKKYLKHYKK